MTVLALNGGSSTLKYALGDNKGMLASGDDLSFFEKWSFEAVGHRIVHGAEAFFEPTLIDEDVLKKLKTLIPFAPLHLPYEIDLIERVKKAFPKIPQVACFDTAFHQTMDDEVKRFPLPKRFEEVKRYGFHGLSCEYIVSALSPLPKRLIIAHIGNGVSLTAVKEGRSIDTTMGLTPTGGVMMGTRTGDLDPGVIFYLMREKGLSVDEVEQICDFESGLKGVGGVSDVKELLRRPNADMALRMYARSIKKAVGALSASLGGVDMLVFTGGVGENAEKVRSLILEGLDFLSIKEVKVMATDEDEMIMRHVRRLLF